MTCRELGASEVKTYEAELPNRSSVCPDFRGDFQSAAAGVLLPGISR